MLHLTEQQRLEALALCDRIVETSARLMADFEKLKQASDEFAAACGMPFSVAVEKCRAVADGKPAPDLAASAETTLVKDAKWWEPRR